MMQLTYPNVNANKTGVCVATDPTQPVIVPVGGYQYASIQAVPGARGTGAHTWSAAVFQVRRANTPDGENAQPLESPVTLTGTSRFTPVINCAGFAYLVLTCDTAEGSDQSTTFHVSLRNGADVPQRGPSTGANSTVASTITDSSTLLAANAARRGATVYNDSAALLYLSLGATATTTSHTVQVLGFGYYEVPYGYTGIVTGRWSTATGSARITELT